MCSFVRFQQRFLDDSSHEAASMESGIEIQINMVIHGKFERYNTICTHKYNKTTCGNYAMPGTRRKCNAMPGTHTHTQKKTLPCRLIQKGHCVNIPPLGPHRLWNTECTNRFWVNISSPPVNGFLWDVLPGFSRTIMTHWARLNESLR